jgi:hypothetical protein
MVMVVMTVSISKARMRKLGLLTDGVVHDGGDAQDGCAWSASRPGLQKVCLSRRCRPRRTRLRL